jgi:hypothetical protein
MVNSAYEEDKDKVSAETISVAQINEKRMKVCFL